MHINYVAIDHRIYTDESFSSFFSFSLFSVVPRGNGRRRSKSPAAKSKSPAKQDASPRMQTRSSSRSPRRRSARALAAAANERQDDEKEEIEFGGPLGAAFIMIMSHATLYYLWISWKFYDSNLVYPSGLGDLGAFFGRMWGHISTHAVPNTEAIAVYWTFIGAQAFFAWIIPGLKMRGLPIRHLGGIRLEYNCNGIYTWYLTLIAMAGLHFGGIWSLASVYHNFGPLMTTAILTQVRGCFLFLFVLTIPPTPFFVSRTSSVLSSTLLPLSRELLTACLATIFMTFLWVRRSTLVLDLWISRCGLKSARHGDCCSS